MARGAIQIQETEAPCETSTTCASEGQGRKTMSWLDFGSLLAGLALLILVLAVLVELLAKRRGMRL